MRLGSTPSVIIFYFTPYIGTPILNILIYFFNSSTIFEKNKIIHYEFFISLSYIILNIF